MSDAHDFSGVNPQKQRTREEILSVVRDYSSVLWDQGQECLRFDWAELAGTAAPTYHYLHQVKHALVPEKARFIGIDREPEVIADCRLRYSAEEHSSCVWVERDAMALVRNYLDMGEGVLERAGVFVYDTTHRIDNESLFSEQLPLLLRFASKQASKYGEFVLVLNVTDQHAAINQTTYRERLLSLLSQWGITSTGTEKVFEAYPAKGAGAMLLSILCFGFEPHNLFTRTV